MIRVSEISQALVLFTWLEVLLDSGVPLSLEKDKQRKKLEHNLKNKLKLLRVP